MANRRAIGGMGNRGGNRPYSQQPFQGNVNPWQGNMSNNMNQGLMSQLSNPQQLALALTSLLQPQQQQMNNPPSLLSLNSGGPGFNQDRGDNGRFGNRERSNFRRPEPYNKNNRGGTWRSVGQQQNFNNRNRNQQGGGGNFNRNKSFGQKKFDDKKKQFNESGSRKDEAEEKNVKKEEKTEETTTKVEDVEQDGEEVETKSDEGPYHDIPQHLLHCFVCSKDMWDGESFQKHVRGRAHKQMMESLEESMGITVNILRENMRLAEEKKMIELNRMQRLNKKPNRKFQEVESHCNMCDFKFLGKIMAHRKSGGHQRLKRFLHPNCNLCDKEFPSRMEWVDHRLTPDHLRELAKYVTDPSKGVGANLVSDESEFDLENIMEELTEQEDDFPIVELDDDLHDLPNRIPGYRQTRLLGSKSLVPFTGFLCEICNSSFTSEEQANNHLKSKKHYLKFVEAAKNRYQKLLQEEKEERDNKAENENEKNDEEEVKQEEEEEGDEHNDGDDTKDESNNVDMYDPEEACNEEDKEKDNKPNGEPETPVVEEKPVQAPTPTKKVQPAPAPAPATPAPAPVTSTPTPVTSTPTPAPAASAVKGRPKRSIGGNVKNGAGPKSRKVSK